MEYFTEFGYTGLLISSFLAATILPFSSELVLSFLLLNGFNPITLVIVATSGNVLGSLVNYAIGLWGCMFVVNKILKISEEEYKKSEKRFHKYGIYSLLFAWVPIIGDPLTVVAGALRINIIVFFALVGLGKLVRYMLVCYLTLA